MSYSYFLNKILHVSGSSSVHHQDIFHCTHSNGICHTVIFWIKFHMFRTVPLSIIRSFSLYTQQWCMSYRFADSSHAVSRHVWHIRLLCVQWNTLDDGQRNCPKHVEFYSKNKFEKLVHLVGFIIRIYHDARSPECEIRQSVSACTLNVPLFLW